MLLPCISSDLAFHLDQLCSFWPQSQGQSPTPVSLPVSRGHRSSLPGITQLLLYFIWVWVGLVTPDDMRGEPFLWDITEEMTNHGLCVAFIEKVSELPAKDTTNRQRFVDSHWQMSLSRLVTHTLFWGLSITCFSILLLVMSGSQLRIGISPPYPLNKV